MGGERGEGEGEGWGRRERERGKEGGRESREISVSFLQKER
jgi:hypothetical protein